MHHSQLIVVQTTTATKQKAELLASLIVSKKLGACVQIKATQSLYIWQNNTKNQKEQELSIKTTLSRYHDLESLILKHHPYDTPQIIATPVLLSSAQYVSWVKKQTEDPN